MLHGDISNKTSKIIAFNIDNLLFMTEKNKPAFNFFSLFNRYTNDFFSKSLNEQFVIQLENIWRRYDCRIYLITFYKNPDEVQEFLQDNNVAFSKLVKINSKDHLRKLVESQYTYYFDNDGDLLSYISCKHALYIDDLSKIIC